MAPATTTHSCYKNVVAGDDDGFSISTIVYSQIVRDSFPESIINLQDSAFLLLQIYREYLTLHEVFPELDRTKDTLKLKFKELYQKSSHQATRPVLLKSGRLNFSIGTSLRRLR